MLRTRAFLLGVCGFVLALGAPLGWLVLRTLQGRLEGDALLAEVSAEASLYAYLLIATAVIFSGFGVLVGRLLDTMMRANSGLVEVAISDVATGLKNARYFRERLNEEAARAKREGVPLAIIIGDLDDFKQVNDRHGHLVGDTLLAAVGQRFRQSVRASDTACRIGGEELAVICPNTSLEMAREIAERIRGTIAAQPVATTAGPLSVTMTLGVAVETVGHDADRLFAAADEAMYAGKRGGRNRVVCAAADNAQSLRPPPKNEQSLRANDAGKRPRLAGRRRSTGRPRGMDVADSVSCKDEPPLSPFTKKPWKSRRRSSVF